MPLRAAKALAIGTLGGAAFAAAGMPLPWMLGAMTAVTASALSGQRVALPRSMRNVCVTILGVMLGASFTPAVVARMGEWIFTLGALAAWGLTAGAAGWFYFRRVVGYDRVTSYFAAAPGGLNEMTLAGARFGADERRIALIHATRVFLTVLCIPIWFRIHDGLGSSATAAGFVGLGAIALGDYLILAGCALGGAYAADRLRIPAGAVIGPMVLSAAVHLAGVTESSPPTLVVWAAQVVIGSALGCQFVGFPLALIGRTILHGAVAGAMMVGLAVAAGAVVGLLAGIPVSTVVLGFAPGGLAEMSLVAIALGADAAFVATHHLVRIVLVVICAAPLFRIFDPPR